MRYRTKPVEIEARHWRDGTVEQATELIDWVLHHGGTATYVGQNEWSQLRVPFDALDIDPFIVVQTLEGPMRCRPGWFIIWGTRGEFYPCAPEPFADKYEEIT